MRHKAINTDSAPITMRHKPTNTESAPITSNYMFFVPQEGGSPAVVMHSHFIFIIRLCVKPITFLSNS